MLRLPIHIWALIFFSSLLQIGMFPIWGPVSVACSALSWISLAPILVALLRRRGSGTGISLGTGFLLGYTCGFLWYLGNCSWIYQTMYLYGGLPKPIALVILILFSSYLGLYHALFAVLVSFVRISRLGVNGALLLSPFIWVAVELARARITGFPWDLLGYTQINNLFIIQLAPIGGVLCLSFVVAAINAGVAMLGISSGRKRILFPLAAASMALIIQMAGSYMARSTAIPFPRQTAVLLQENIAVGITATPDQLLTTNQEFESFSSLSLHPRINESAKLDHAVISRGVRISPDLIVWPEAPSHFQSNDPDLNLRLGNLARAANVPVIAGSLGLDPDPSRSRGYALYDSALLFDASGEYRGRYDKIHLVPWGEFIPFKSFFSFAHKLTEGAGDMDRGHERSIFRVNGRAYGIFICYESIFGDEVREFVKNGAEVLINISDDGWYGDTGAPWQHLNMARMRAIENNRWVLRSTNTGITTAIDPQGRARDQAPRHVRAAFMFPFSFTQEITFYTQHGDWFAYLCAAITMLALAFSFAYRVRSRPNLHALK